MTRTVTAYRETMRGFRKVFGQSVETLVRAFGTTLAVQYIFIMANDPARPGPLPQHESDLGMFTEQH